MRSYKMPKKPVAWLQFATAALFVMNMFCPPQALAEIPARFYWKTLSGGSAVPLIVESVSGNTNPFDPSRNVTPGASFDATLALAGYAQTFSLMDRSAMAAVHISHGTSLGRRQDGRWQILQSIEQRFWRSDA